VPVAIPLTTPFDAPIVATLVLLLAHVPPATVLDKDVIWLTHMLDVPEIVPADVSAFTVTVAVLRQPVPSVYVMSAVPPVTPVTIPLASTVATDGVPLAHVPPPEALDNVIDADGHTEPAPVIADGSAFTVTTPAT
jgi:hypothetical protein